MNQTSKLCDFCKKNKTEGSIEESDYFEEYIVCDNCRSLISEKFKKIDHRKIEQEFIEHIAQFFNDPNAELVVFSKDKKSEPER